MKVLVVEDDPDQLSLRCLLLARSGFEVIAAADSASALAMAMAHRPDCAIVDLRLPTQELGLQLLRELKSRHPAVRVLVITGADVRRLDQNPDYKLIDGVVKKGSSSAALIRKLKALANPS
jgi:DNA-binding response OmpR family regulator